MGLIQNDDVWAYREEVEQVYWCRRSNLILNVKKTKLMIVDIRKNQLGHSPLLINNTAVKVVGNTKFLGVHITDILN